MYLLGHVGSAALIGYLWWRRRPDFPFWFLLFGSMLPDMIDKPIGSLLFNRGRFIAHSIVFNIAWFLVAWFALPEHRERVVAVFSGALIHLVGDINEDSYEAFLWPFMGWQIPEGTQFAFLGGHKHTWVMVAELIGLTIIIVVGYKMRWTKREWQVMGIIIALYVVAYLLAVILFL